MNRDYKRSKKIHFKRRFKERVGYELTDDRYNEIRDNITNKGVFLYRSEGGSSVYKYDLNGLSIKIAYDTITNVLVTVLT